MPSAWETVRAWLRAVRESRPWKAVADLSVLSWIVRGVISGLVGRAAAVSAYMHNRPLYVIILVGSAAFALAMIAATYAVKLYEKLAGRGAKKATSQTQTPAGSGFPNLLGSEVPSVEPRAFTSPAKIEPGNTHQIAFAGFLNDPTAVKREAIDEVSAQLTYFDSSGTAYLTVERGLWAKGGSITAIPVGRADRLVVAVLDPHEGRAFTLDHTEKWVDEWVDDHPTGHWSYAAHQVELRKGPGKLSVRVAYHYADSIPWDAPLLNSQRFEFRLNVGKRLQLEAIPA